MPKQIIKFQCEHCRRKVLASIYKIRDHEKICFFNPEVKSCITCSNMVDGQFGPWCDLYAMKILVKGNPISLCSGWAEKIEEDFE